MLCVLHLSGRDITLIDPARIEPRNLGEMAHMGLADVGRYKVEAVPAAAQAVALQQDGFLSGFYTPLLVPIAAESARTACARADVLICCVDRNTSRVAAGQLTTWYHKMLLDIGTGTFFYPTPGEMSGRPDRTQGIDIRPIVPGDGCLLCWAQAATDLAHNRTPGIQRQRQEERAGSLLALNHMAAARGILLLLDLVSERIQASRWEQIAMDANGRLLPHNALARQTAVSFEIRHRGALGLLLSPSAQVSCQLLPHCWINPTPSRPPQCSDMHRHPGIGR